jgi:hypothetical protein
VVLREQSLIDERGLKFDVVPGVDSEAGSTTPTFWKASYQLSPSLLRASARLYWICVIPYSHDHPEKKIWYFLPCCRYLSRIVIQAQPEYVVRKAMGEVAKTGDE